MFIGFYVYVLIEDDYDLYMTWQWFSGGGGGANSGGTTVHTSLPEVPINVESVHYLKLCNYNHRS